MGVSEATFYRWKKQFAGMGVAGIRHLKQQEDENRRLARLIADLTLDKRMPKDVLSKKLQGRCASRTGERDVRSIPSKRTAGPVLG